MEVSSVELSKLVHYNRNNKKHSPVQVRKIADSIREFGFRNPVLVDKNFVIIAGHGRALAAELLGLKEIPCIKADDLTPEQCRAYRLADNRLADLAEYDYGNVKFELDDLKNLNFDINLTGFDLDMPELNSELDNPIVEDDFTPPVKAKYKVEHGDIFTLGRHRIGCLDATKKEDVERLINKNEISLILTDPPYGIKRDEGFGGFEGVGEPIARKRYTGDWDSDRPPKYFFEDLIKLSDKIMIFGGNYFADYLPQGKHWIVWDKKNTMPTFGDAELIWTNMKRDSVKIKEFEYNGLIGKEKERFHATQKPVKLLVNLLNEYCENSGIVLDLFLGSGSTLIACEQTGRVCYGSEIDPYYVSVILERYVKFKGGDADVFRLNADGGKTQVSGLIN